MHSNVLLNEVCVDPFFDSWQFFCNFFEPKFHHFCSVPGTFEFHPWAHPVSGGKLGFDFLHNTILNCLSVFDVSHLF